MHTHVCVRMDVCGCGWMCVGGCGWGCIDVCGCAWMCEGVGGCVCAWMCIHSCLNICLCTQTLTYAQTSNNTSSSGSNTHHHHPTIIIISSNIFMMSVKSGGGSERDHVKLMWRGDKNGTRRRDSHNAFVTILHYALHNAYNSVYISAQRDLEH